MIEQLDQPQRQVLIQVLLAEVTLDGSFDKGLDWSDNRLNNVSSNGDSKIVEQQDFLLVLLGRAYCNDNKW